ncbi:MAG: tRNA (adenosine(37)-N6)-dimethylallyltransferase MiaA [Tannerella sp.]|jgi:tRNA dimethylallyltransferase|nr:tRNA (adenosine(37)-N6)-dimethylallyltransferase MiaA [Tannerella sp.]
MKILFVLLGPTGVGKTALSIAISRHIGSPVISADSRQIYKELPVGTAAPSKEQLALVKHYFVATHTLSDYYSASIFEEEATSLINKLHESQPFLLLCGGSMMYIDAVCKGIDEMPTVTQDIRDALWEQYDKEGLAPILEELKKTDPTHYNNVDRMNHRRVIHAVEICRMTGKPYSSFRTNTVKERPYIIHKIGLMRERQELFNRINKRVDMMFDEGLAEEAQRAYPMRNLNSLNTVGYKELFLYFDGTYTFDETVEKIKRNTRIYARKQITWLKRDVEIKWFHPDNEEDIISHIDNICNTIS